MVLLVLVAGIVLAVYWPVLPARAITFDDDEYLLDNYLVQQPSWASAGRFFGEVLAPSTVRGYYQPLTMVSLMLDCALGGRPDNLAPFHATSLSLHAVNTALLIVLLYLLFGAPWVAAGVGLLFGLHPVTIESVAWIAQRKSLLAAFFSLWCLVLYVWHVRRKRAAPYVGSLVACVLALLSKPIAIPLPLLLLLLDFWPLRRLNRWAVIEKTPFFVLAGLAAVVGFLSQGRTYGVALPGELSPWHVPLLLCHNIVFYLYKLLWPANLSWYYTYPVPFNLSQRTVLAGVVGTVLLLPLLLLSLRWTRALLTGWLFFFIAVLPTIGIVSFWGLIAADRFVYLPMIGLLLPLACWLVCQARAARAGPTRAARWAGPAIVVLLLAGTEAVTTRRYLAPWRDSESLARHMVRLVPNAEVPHVGLANCLQARGQVDEALAEYRRALRLNPSSPDAHTGLGAALMLQGQIDGAVAEYRQALALKPADPRTHNNLGAGLLRAAALPEAISHLRQALHLRPQYPEAHKNLGNALTRIGQLEEAAVQYRAALRLQPDDFVAHLMLGEALAQLNQTAEAEVHCAAAVRLKPDHAGGRAALANVLAVAGQADEAIVHYLAALRVNPDDAATHFNVATVLARLGRTAEAVDHLRAALRLQPDDAEAHSYLAITLTQQGKLEEAVTHGAEAVRINPHHAEAHNNLAVTLDRLGRTDEAVAHFRAALAERPDSAAVHQNLAAALARLGRLDEALEHYRAALRLSPNAADLYAALGACLAQRGELDEAIANCRQAVQLDPANAEARSKLADLLEHKGLMAEAAEVRRAAEQLAAEHAPGSPGRP